MIVHLRQYQSSDAPILAELFRDAVNGIGPQAYSAEQIAAWAAYGEDVNEFRKRVSLGVTVVAEADARLVAFGQLHPINHIELIYCATAYARRGIASSICAELEHRAAAAGATRICTEASRIARPFFEKRGYALVGTERVSRGGIEFERFTMEKRPLIKEEMPSR